MVKKSEMPVEKLRISINAFKDYTHFYETKDGWVELFRQEPCESCGEPCQCANNIRITRRSLLNLMGMGMKYEKVDKLPPESYYSDELQQCACYGCNK